MWRVTVVRALIIAAGILGVGIVALAAPLWIYLWWLR